MNDEFVVVQWPESQSLMSIKGFEQNCCLINDNPFLEEYGLSAYFVRKIWLESIEGVELSEE